VYTTDTDLRYTWVYNPHPAFKPEDVLGRRDDQLLTPEQAEPLIALKRDALESGVGRREEFAVVVDGQLHVYDLTVEPLRDSDGAVVGLTAAAMDITEHKRAEAALRESEARLQLALRASKGGAWDWDITRNVASVSDSYRDLYGLRPDQAVDFNVWLSIVHPEDRERCRLYCEQYFQSGTDFTLDFRIVHPQLGERWLAGYGWLERNSAGQTTRFVGINLDITERKQAEERLNAALAQRTEEVQRAERHLATAQRMAAVGTMAAGLAHDMSNVLMPLSARLDALLDHAGGGGVDGATHDHLTAIQGLMEHLRDMAKNLSLFARDPQKEGIIGKTNLYEWRKNSWRFIEASVRGPGSRKGGAGFDLDCDVPKALPPVAIAPHRLTQVVQNLIHNARDAVLARGSSSEGGASHYRGKITLKARHDISANTVVLSVNDNGIGMDEETKRRCIEPFFTTRDRATVGAPAGSGTGLGLALVQQIVEHCGGTTNIESAPNPPDQGTTITITLPAVNALA
jgi:PAS domain S-box-containing protein